MTAALASSALDQTFFHAHTANRFTAEPVSDATLHALYDLCKFGPTSMNCQPLRLVFVRGAEAKALLKDTLSPGNLDKTMAAPVTAILAVDTAFHEHLPGQFPSGGAAAAQRFADSPAMAAEVGRVSGTLQGGYLILAARMLGLDVGPMGGFDRVKVDAAFFPDGRFQSFLLVNLGYADPAGNRPRGPRLEFEQVARIL
ncbi:malonic semialdehyde reductase [Sphaerotilus sp.]|uniref:malonic semialdehyde reductase n=1 Tax=Sphaerotilus sp. TaxID=2093942 RepID=UPI0034E2F1DE